MTRASASTPLFCLTLLVSLSAAPLAAQDAALELRWENIFRERSGAQSVALSPDGLLLAVGGRRADQQGIFLQSVDGGGRARYWVAGTSPAWFADGRQIVYVHDNDLWTVGADSNEPVRITTSADSERAPQPSPDMRWVAFYSTRSGHQDLWLVPSDGSAPPRQLTKASMAADDARFAPAWSPNSKQIAYFSNRSDYWADDLWVVDITSGNTRQVSRGFMMTSPPAWSPDGMRIAVMGTAKSGFWYQDLSDIYVLDPVDGSERAVAMQIPATDFVNKHAVHWSADGEELFFPYHERGNIELWRVPVHGGVATRVTNMGGSFGQYDAAGSGFAFVRSHATRGPDVDYVALQGGEARRLTHFATDWRGLRAPVELSYRSWDGLYIQGFLFTPPGFNERRKYPTLVMVHGGGTNAYYQRLQLVEQRLARQGYVVLAVNYRGGSGFGREFQDLGVGDWGNGQALDAAAAAAFVRAEPWSNDKVGIYGYSYGGITTMAAITRAPHAFDAAVPMAGIYDFADAYAQADRVGKIFIRTGHGGSPAERPGVYANSNALARIGAIDLPLLIMHGEADVRAPYRQFELAVELLRRHDKVFEARSYPGEAHGFADPHNRIDLYQRLQAWFDRHLK